MIKIKFQRLLLIYGNYCLSCMPASMFRSRTLCALSGLFITDLKASEGWFFVKEFLTMTRDADLKYFRLFESDHFVIRWVRCQASKRYNEQNTHLFQSWLLSLPSAILQLDWRSTPAKMTRNTDICPSNILSPGIDSIFYSDTE